MHHIVFHLWRNLIKYLYSLHRGFSRYFTQNTGWTLPALFAILRDLRDIALDVRLLSTQVADHYTESRQADIASQKTESMEDAARVITRAFTDCVTDRLRRFLTYPRMQLTTETFRMSVLSESRKWGVYYVLGLVMKCYFRVSLFQPNQSVVLFFDSFQVKRIALSKNILRALEANPDIPLLSEYPRAHQVAFVSTASCRYLTPLIGNIPIFYWDH